MADFSRTSTVSAVNTSIDRSASEISTNKMSYWKQMLKSYEKRNASLERRRSVLVERVRFMECTLPSLLMGVAASTAYGKRNAPDKQVKIKNTPKPSAQRT